MDDWTGIADADAHLGERVPLPTAVLPLTRWVEVHPVSADAVEVGVIAWDGRGWLRPGSQVFTTEADHERLADVLMRRLG